MLAAFAPPKAIFNKIKSLFANFFWGGFKCHWIKWSQCCLPIFEGGLGIRKLEEDSITFSMKSWWSFRTSNSIWAIFMRAKYDKFLDGTRSVGGSSNWKRLIQAKEAADSHITWIVGK